MIKQPNSRQKRKFKCGFKGEGSHKRFGIGHLAGKEEILLGSYNTELNRDITGNNKKYANVVHAAIMHNGAGWKMDNNGKILGYTPGSKHIGSKPLRNILRAI